jgi:hypothetical protein
MSAQSRRPVDSGAHNAEEAFIRRRSVRQGQRNRIGFLRATLRLLEQAWLHSPGDIRWLAGEANPDTQAALWPGVGGNRGVVRVGDGGDDGQADPMPAAVAVAGAGGGQALEGPEQPVDLGGRDHRASVGHRDDGAAVLLIGGEVDGAVSGVVADGVVEQVDGQPFDQAGVAEHRRGAQRGLHLELLPPCLGAGGAQAGRGSLGQVRGLAVADAAFAGGQGE